MSATKELRALLDSHGVEVRLHKPVTKAELARENAKLRELVRDMFMQLLNAYDPKEIEEFTDRVHELGVEVEG